MSMAPVSLPFSSFSSSLLLVFLLFSFLFLLSQQQQQPSLDSVEQESVYLALESVNSDIPWRSLFPDDLCLSAPHGVVCGFFPSATASNDTVLVPHVVELNFGCVSDSSQNPPCSPSSDFPLSVFSLPHLRKIFFYRCFTKKPVSFPVHDDPKLFGSELEELVLIENPSLSGSFAGVLRNFISLRRLILIGSNVSGGIPDEITLLPSLQQLTISGNRNLGGEIPANLGFLTNLKVLDLSSNGLKGTVPESLKQLHLLLKLDLSYNDLVGKIPESLKALQKLQFLDLSYNRFGNFGVPMFLGAMPFLREVYLSGNPLGGTIPEIWENLGDILGIGFSGVGLVGNIPPSMGVYLRNLSYLRLDNNKLEGTVPEEFGLLEHVQEMNFQSNHLSGKLPFSAQFAARIGNKLKVKGNSELCVEKSLKKSVQSKGILGNLRACNGTEVPTSVLINGSPSLSLNWYTVILILGFWSFSSLWSLL